MSRSRKFDKYDKYIDGPKSCGKKSVKKSGKDSVLKISSKQLSNLVEVGNVYTINSKFNCVATEKSCKGFVGMDIYSGEKVFIPTSEIFTIEDFVGVLNSLIVKICDDGSSKTRTCIYDIEQKGSLFLKQKYDKEKDLSLFGEFDTIYEGNVENLKSIGEGIFLKAKEILEHCVAFDLQVIVE